MLCDIVPCGKKVLAKGMCGKHYQRYNRYGNPHVVKKKRGDTKPKGHENPSYEVLHGRIRAARGPAKEHRCVDCGGKARDWSYNHSGIGEYMAWSKVMGPLPASNDFYQYEPRCKLCHMIFDHNREVSHAEGLLPTAP
jgi:hypothetical protein